MKEGEEKNICEATDQKDLLLRAACEMGIVLGEREFRLFGEYRQELLFWNQRMNLVSLKSPLDLVVKHFADSLTALPDVAGREGPVLDMGSGAGFPAIPLKILCDSLRISLLESSRKKTSFLRNVIAKLGLGGMEVIHRRAEDALQEAGRSGSFYTVISRATFKLPEFLRLGAGFLVPGGMLVAMKGPGYEAELEAARALSAEAGMKWSGSRSIRLPITGDFRKIIIFQKAYR